MTTFLRRLLRPFTPLPTPHVLTATLREWRSNDTLVVEATKVLSTPILRSMLATLRNDAPWNYALSPGTSVEDRAIHQGKTEGFALALNSLEAMGQPEPFHALGEPTFPAQPTVDLPSHYGENTPK